MNKTLARPLLAAGLVSAAITLTACGTDTSDPTATSPSPTTVAIPAEQRAAAAEAEAAGQPYRWDADTCHSYYRTPTGDVFWLTHKQDAPNASSWNVAVRGWPTAPCSAEKPEFSSEPCDQEKAAALGPEWSCGAGGGFGPGITDGNWADVSGQGELPRTDPDPEPEGLAPGDGFDPGDLDCTTNPDNGMRECTFKTEPAA